MKNFLVNVGASLLTAALIANVTVLWSVNSRLTRIETKLETPNTITASTP